MTTEEEILEFLKYVEIQHPDGTRTPLDVKDYQLAFLKEVVNNQKDIDPDIRQYADEHFWDMVHIKRRKK